MQNVNNKGEHAAEEGVWKPHAQVFCKSKIVLKMFIK